MTSTASSDHVPYSLPEQWRLLKGVGKPCTCVSLVCIESSSSSELATRPLLDSSKRLTEHCQIWALPEKKLYIEEGFDKQEINIFEEGKWTLKRPLIITTIMAGKDWTPTTKQTEIVINGLFCSSINLFRFAGFFSWRFFHHVTEN